MNILIAVTLWAGLLCGALQAGQGKQAKQSKQAATPTLEETKKYIATMLESQFVMPNEAIHIKSSTGESVDLPIEKVTNVSFVGCVLVYDTFASTNSGARTYNQKLPLSTVYEISTGQVAGEVHWNRVMLRLSTPVTRTFRITHNFSKAEPEEKDVTLQEVSFDIRNEDDATRLQNAFSVATGMCGAKPDPFDPKNFPPRK